MEDLQLNFVFEKEDCKAMEGALIRTLEELYRRMNIGTCTKFSVVVKPDSAEVELPEPIYKYEYKPSKRNGVKTRKGQGHHKKGGSKLNSQPKKGGDPISV